MKICMKCVLAESFPGIRFNEDGICSYCSRFKGTDSLKKQKKKFRQKFNKILNETAGRSSYDALMAYSGGKDSTYILKLLKEDFDLRILAITFDHGFVSPMALENIRNITDKLDIDHMTVRPGIETLRNVFVKSMAPDMYPIKSLERASSICNSCMNLVKSFLLRTAIDLEVPMVAYGWSPGQAPIQSSVFKTNASMIRQMQKAMVRPFQEMIGDRLSAYFLEEQHLFDDPSSKPDRFPYLIHPLAFLDYDEKSILNKIKEIGWKDPKDTDANSTNCLLNGFANKFHMKQHGFHPYSFEIAGLVREGYMTREEGLNKLSVPPDPGVLTYVKKRLRIEE